MPKNLTPNQSKTILNEALNALGLSFDIKTDPRLMQEIIRDIKLDDFVAKNVVMDKFFKNIGIKSLPLEPMLKNIEKALLKKHPAIIEFLEVALEKKWLKPSRHIVRAVHVTYILEHLTMAMCNNYEFFVEIQDHYKIKERECGIDSRRILKTFFQALKLSHNLFGSVKSWSIDPAMIYFRTRRGLSKSHVPDKQARKLLKAGRLNYFEYRLLSSLDKNGIENINDLVRINIYEAGISEHKNDLQNNALVAHILAEAIRRDPPQAEFKKKAVLPDNSQDPFYKSISEEDNLFPVISFSRKWTRLYVTWNMAFVLKRLDDLDLMFPMLLIPSIIDAKSDNFVGTRLISLWLTLNSFLYRKYEKKIVCGPVNKAEMAQTWAKINKKYALEYAKEELKLDEEALTKGFKKFYARPVWNWLKLLLEA